MTPAELNHLLAAGECQFFDVKSARIQPRDLAHHLIAFANADGGVLALGIENDRTVTGVKRHADTINGFLQAGIDFCTPSIRVVHALVDCTNSQGHAAQVLVLTVPQSDRVHASTRDADVARRLNIRQVAALGFLRTHDRIQTADLMRMFPTTNERTARRDLNSLVGLGLLERSGRTRGAFYHIGGVVYRVDGES